MGFPRCAGRWSARRLAFIFPLARLPLLVAALFLAFIVCSHNIVWSQPENGPRRQHLLWKDYATKSDRWLAIFDWKVMEGGAPRITRTLSSAFDLGDTYFRNWFHANVFPHPSISITWLFSLVLSPILLFRAMRNTGYSSLLSSCGVAIYLSLPGVLSLVAMDFRTGKALAMFSFVLIFYLMSRARPLLALLTYSVALATDEIAVFSLALFFVLLDFRERKNWSVPATAVLLTGLYAVAAKTVLLDLYTWAGYPVTGSYEMEARITWAQVSHAAGLVWPNFLAMLRDVTGVGLAYDPTFWPNRLLGIASAAGLAGALVVAMVRGVSPRYAILLAIGFVMHCFLISLTPHAVWGSYWYGVFLALPFALLLVGVLRHIPPGAAVALTIVLIVSNFVHFIYTNYAYKHYHYYPWRAGDIHEVFSRPADKFSLKDENDIDNLRKITRNFTKMAKDGSSVKLPNELGYLTAETNLCAGSYRLIRREVNTFEVSC